MAYTIFTDPHLGTARTAHTSRSSSEALRLRLFKEADKLASLENPICCGDLFDKSNNNEETILHGFKVASNCKYVLAGNHDEDNVVGRVTSLRAIQSMGVTSIVSSDNLAKPYFFADGKLVFVPHHISQALFEEAIGAAFDNAIPGSVLFLHCNYDFYINNSDATLNLPATLAEKLLEKFNFIFIGHEHGSKEDFDGRVCIVGNTFPTSFSDISTKSCVVLSDDLTSYERKITFDAEVGFLTLNIDDAIDENKIKAASFIEVVGKVASPTEFIKLQSKLWDINSEIYCIRNNTSVATEVAAPVIDKSGFVSLEERLHTDIPEKYKNFMTKLLNEVV